MEKSDQALSALEKTFKGFINIQASLDFLVFYMPSRKTLRNYVRLSFYSAATQDSKCTPGEKHYDEVNRSL